MPAAGKVLLVWLYDTVAVWEFCSFYWGNKAELMPTAEQLGFYYDSQGPTGESTGTQPTAYCAQIWLTTYSRDYAKLELKLNPEDSS